MTDLTPADLAARLEREFPHPYPHDLRAAIAMIKEQGEQISSLAAEALSDQTRNRLGHLAYENRIQTERAEQAEAERDRLRAGRCEHGIPIVDLCSGITNRDEAIEQLRDTVQRVDTLCSNAEKSQATRIGRDFNGKPFPAILHVEHVRAALNGGE